MLQIQTVLNQSQRFNNALETREHIGDYLIIEKIGFGGQGTYYSLITQSI